MAALQNQKAVYLITDRSNGKLYVGSATSDSGMLLQRWANYIDSGHGGNKELIELVNKEGIDYIKRNFQYSILENYNAKVGDENGKEAAHGPRTIQPTIFFRKFLPNHLHPINLCPDIVAPSAGGRLFAGCSPAYISERESGVVSLLYRSVWRR